MVVRYRDEIDTSSLIGECCWKQCNNGVSKQSKEGDRWKVRTMVQTCTCVEDAGPCSESSFVAGPDASDASSSV